MEFPNHLTSNSNSIGYCSFGKNFGAEKEIEPVGEGEREMLNA